MKLQHLTVIFIIIILPISLIMGEYIQSQIDTINLQSQYSKKLQDATYDAMKAFQINTLNNKYSSNSDSKIRDIEASVTAFYNSISTSMSASGYDKDSVKEFVPAMVYTLYDGYYIYGKYYDYNNDGQNGEYKKGLKPYIYYSCRYVNGNSDFVVNYTLDNYITVYGKIKGKYITKSGYVINPNKVSECTDFIKITDEETINKLYDYGYSINNEFYKDIKYPTSITYDNDVQINREILSETLVVNEVNENNDKQKPDYINQLIGNGNVISKDETSFTRDSSGNILSGYVKANYEYVVYKNQKIYKDLVTDIYDRTQYFLYDNTCKKQYLTYSGEPVGTEQYLDDDSFDDSSSKPKIRGIVTSLMYAIAMTDSDGHLRSNSAVEYYDNAKNFSKWLDGNLGNISQEDAVDINGNQIGFIKDENENYTWYFNTNTESKKIFKFDQSNDNIDPLAEGSTFDENRLSVIRKSIETNLKSAIANYSEGTALGYDFQMPILTDEDWDKLLNNVSLSVFMQGVPIKAKYFNSYCIITNDKNKEVVTEDSIYIVTEKDGKYQIHLPGCTELLEDNSYNIIGAYNTIDFERQTITIAQEDKYYFYPQYHQTNDRKSATNCYNCIVNISKNYDVNGIITGNMKVYDKETDRYVYKDTDGAGVEAKNEANRLSTYVKDSELRKKYLTALGRCRHDLYKTNSNM